MSPGSTFSQICTDAPGLKSCNGAKNKESEYSIFTKLSKQPNHVCLGRLIFGQSTALWHRLGAILGGK